MIVHVCDDCGLKQPTKGDTPNTPDLPSQWITLTIQGLKQIVCSWECAEQLSRRMISNRDHCDTHPDRVPPAWRGRSVVLDEPGAMEAPAEAVEA